MKLSITARFLSIAVLVFLALTLEGFSHKLYAQSVTNGLHYMALPNCDSVLIYAVNPNSVFCGFKQTQTNSTRKVVIGNADGSNADFTFPSPLANSFKSVKQQFLYKADELKAAGLVPGVIVALGFQLADTVGALAQYNFYNIKMGCTNLDSLDHLVSTGFTQVFGTASVTPSQADSFYFGIGVGNFYFNWDGQSNIIVEICTSNLLNASTQNAHFKFQNTPYKSTSVAVSNTISVCTMIGNPDFVLKKRPLTQFFQNDNSIPGFWLNGSSVADSTKSITTAPVSSQPFVWQTNDFNGNFLRLDTLFIPQNSLSIQGASSICKGDSVILTALSSSTCADFQGQRTFTWTNSQQVVLSNDSSVVVFPDSSQTYYCQFENGCGCILIDSITVFVTEVEIQATTLATPGCGLNNGAFQLSGNGGSGNYQFSIDSGLTYSPQSLYSQQYQGFFWVSIEDASGCKSPQPIAFALNNSLSFDSINVQNVACYEGNSGQIELYLTGGNANNFFFLNNQYANIIGVFSSLNADYYVVGVETFIGCKFDTLIRITQPNSISIEAKTTYNSCIGSCNGKIAVQSISGGTAPYQLSWSNGSSLDSIEALCSGFYSLLVTDNQGCTESQSFAIITEHPFSLTPVFPDSNFSVLLIASNGVEPIQYQWTNGGSNEYLVATSTGEYIVTATDANGCEIIDTFQLVLNAVEPMVSDVAKIYPNPTNADVTIELANNMTGGASVQVYAALGQLLYEQNNAKGTIVLNSSEWAAGVYFIRVFDGHQQGAIFKLVRSQDY